MKAPDLIALNQQCSHCGTSPLPEDYVILQRWYEILFFLIAVVRSGTKKLEEARCILKKFNDTNNYITICFEHVGEVFQQFKNILENTPADGIIDLIDEIDTEMWFHVFGYPRHVLKCYGKQFLEENRKYLLANESSLETSGERLNNDDLAAEGVRWEEDDPWKVRNRCVIRVRGAERRETRTNGMTTKSQKVPKRACKVCGQRPGEHQITSTPFKLFIMMYTIESNLLNKEQVRGLLSYCRLVVCSADLKRTAEMIRTYLEVSKDGEFHESDMVRRLKKKIEHCLLGGIELAANITSTCESFVQKYWKEGDAQVDDCQEVEGVHIDGDEINEVERSASAEASRPPLKSRNFRKCTVCNNDPSSTTEVKSKARMLLIAFDKNNLDLLKVKARSWRVCRFDLQLAAETVMNFLNVDFDEPRSFGSEAMINLEEELKEFTSSLDDFQFPKNLFATCRTFCMEHAKGESTYRRRRTEHSPDPEEEIDAVLREKKERVHLGSDRYWKLCKICKEWKVTSELSSEGNIVCCLIYAELSGKVVDAKAEYKRADGSCKRLIVCSQCLETGAQFISTFLGMKNNGDFDDKKLEECMANVERITENNVTKRELLKSIKMYCKRYSKNGLDRISTTTVA